jgi:hypothetical protein
MKIGADFNQQWVRIPTKNKKINLILAFFYFKTKSHAIEAQRTSQPTLPFIFHIK